METINGLTLTVRGAELIRMARDRADYAATRIEKLTEALGRVEGMAPEDREIAGFKLGSGDMKDEVEKKLQNQRKNLRYYQFIADHLEATSSYRISADSTVLSKLGISHSNRY